MTQSSLEWPAGNSHVRNCTRVEPGCTIACDLTLIDNCWCIGLASRRQVL